MLSMFVSVRVVDMQGRLHVHGAHNHNFHSPKLFPLFTGGRPGQTLREGGKKHTFPPRAAGTTYGPVASRQVQAAMASVKNGVS
jgi:hypothetical protein